MTVGDFKEAHREAVDLINEPPHYTRLSPEPIDVIESWDLDHHRSTAIKYLARAGCKDGESEVKDLKKARWYIDRKIAQLERAG